MTACGSFIKESRMKLAEPTGLNRKSRVWGAHCFVADPARNYLKLR